CRSTCLAKVVPTLASFAWSPRRRRPPPFPYTTLFRSDARHPRPQGRSDGEGRGRGADGARRCSDGPGEPAGVRRGVPACARARGSEEHTSELQSQSNIVCRLLAEKKKEGRTGDAQMID